MLNLSPSKYMTVVDLFVSFVIAIFLTILMYLLVIIFTEDNYRVIIPKYNSTDNTLTIKRLENTIEKLNNQIEEGTINIHFLSEQKKLVETHLHAIKKSEITTIKEGE